MAAGGSNNFGIRDNHSRGKVADSLVDKIPKQEVTDAIAAVTAFLDLVARK